MKIILSPAKKMNVANDDLSHVGLPVFMKETERILDWMRKLSFEEAKNLWACNDKIARLNFERCESMDLYRNLTPAILSYEGIAYQYMAPTVFEDGQFDYIQKHLRILSGFYGVLKPMDGVTPYRLEMQARAKISGKKDLYEFWGDRLYREVVFGGAVVDNTAVYSGDVDRNNMYTDDTDAGECRVRKEKQDRVILNLASKEYSKCIEKYLRPEDTYITCVFGEMEKGKIVQKGVYAKMARGEMVRYMAEKEIEDPQKIKKFDRLGYRFIKELSSETEFVFLKN